MRKFILVLLVFIPFTGSILFGRDINLDEIYIKHSSRYLKKLVLEKLDTYEKVDAVFIDRDIIFSGWISGDRIVYVKETPVGNINIIYKYLLRKKRREEIYRLKGVISFARLGNNGRYLFLKMLKKGKGIIPEGVTISLNIQTGKKYTCPSTYPFLDFSISGKGNSIVYETRRGFIEYYPVMNLKRLVLRRGAYSNIISSGRSIAYISPNHKKVLVINGGGGTYRAKIIQKNRSQSVSGISSSSEIFWIDNSRIVFRRGNSGFCSVVLYNVRRRRSRVLIRNSFNTNILYSKHPGIISFLNDQIIMIYKMSRGRLTNTGLEGEDISFDPNGKLFTSLIFKKLFVVNLNTLMRKRVELRRAWRALIKQYRILSGKPDHFDNSFSRQYINRKIAVYARMLR